jgi:hypothetical protein
VLTGKTSSGDAVGVNWSADLARGYVQYCCCDGTAIIAGIFKDANPPSENDYSIGAVLGYGAFDE